MDLSVDELVARTYDAAVPDWPGEIDFYRALAADARSAGKAVLEIACGTGRVAVRLASDGVSVTGLDFSPTMLEVGRAKSAGMPNVRWVEADMRRFDLGETFGLIIIPGHAFQNLVTPEDQVSCLECIGRHLAASGVLVIHLDHQELEWLGELCTGKGGVFEPGEELAHPVTGRPIRTSRAWSYERSTQTASLTTVWHELDAQGQTVGRWERGPIRLHCVFRFEMEHLLARTGFKVTAVFGDFDGGSLRDDSTQMVWVARARSANRSGQPTVAAG